MRTKYSASSSQAQPFFQAERRACPVLAEAPSEAEGELEGIFLLTDPAR